MSPSRGLMRLASRCLFCLFWMLWLGVVPLHAQLVMRSSARSLAGLPGVRVVIGQLTSEAMGGGLDSVAIRTQIELELRRAGVRIFHEEETRFRPDVAVLLLNLVVMPDRATGGYFYRAKMELRQDVRLARDADVSIPATTWAARDAIIALGGRFNLRDDVAGTCRAQVTEFLNDYLAANPRTAAR